jgi:hypothetical protein
MRASGPAARTTHTLKHFIKANSYTPLSRFIFFGRRNPANPFVAREWRYISPESFCTRIRVDRFAKIGWHSMY